MAWDDLFRIAAEPVQLGSSIGANLGAIGWRWWHSFLPGKQPKVAGARLEVGHALEMLAPNYGVAPSAIRRLLAGRPALLALDEVLDMATSIHLTYSAEQPYVHGQAAWPLSTFEELLKGRRLAQDLAQQSARWWISDQQLVADLLLEGELLRHRREVAEQIGQQRPQLVYEKRVAPFGGPPSPRSRYYSLFAWLDRRLEGQFRVQMEELEKIFSGMHPDLQAVSPRPTNPGPLPGSAHTTPGWWSNPRASSARGLGVGSQGQRIAWLSAGYRAKPLIKRDPVSSSVSVVSVEFQAIPGREQWHPFRDRFRHPEGELDALTDGLGSWEETVELLEDQGTQVLRWFDRIGSIWDSAQQEIKARTGAGDA
jgi:hypothetical protein